MRNSLREMHLLACHRRIRRGAGFSLIELTMVIVVVGILAAAATPLLVNSFRTYEANQSNLVTLTKLRYATERMAREIRDVQCAGGVCAIVMGPASLQFTKNDAAGTVVTITAAPPLVTLTYSTPPMTATLTDQVAGLQFDYYDISNSNVGVTTANVAYVDVDLTLTDPTSGAAQQRTRIALRNR